MPQYLASSIDPASGEVLLAPGEDRHLLLACRGRVGETVTVFDGEGTRARAILEDVAGGRAILRLTGTPERPPVPSPRLLLLQGIPARSAFETIIAEAVELGVAGILPVIAARTTRPPRGFGDRSGRWRSIVLAAAKQCLRPDLPPIAEPVPLARAAEAVGDAGGIVLAGPSSPPLGAVAASFPPGRGLALAVGPEGGWTPGEIALLTDHGFAPASLGPFVLRSETAAAVALGAARLARAPGG